MLEKYGINTNIFKKILEVSLKNFPRADFIDGIMMGVLIQQDYSKMTQVMEQMKKIQRKTQFIHPQSKPVSYSKYIEPLMESIHKTNSDFNAPDRRISKNEPDSNRRIKKEVEKAIEKEPIAPKRPLENHIEPQPRYIIKNRVGQCVYKYKESKEESDEEFDIIVTNSESNSSNCCICHNADGDFEQSTTCDHLYHKECFEKYIQSRLYFSKPIVTCPAKSCSKAIPRKKILECLNPIQIVVFDSLQLFLEINEGCKYITFWCQKCRKFFAQKRNDNSC